MSVAGTGMAETGADRGASRDGGRLSAQCFAATNQTYTNVVFKTLFILNLFFFETIVFIFH